MSNETKARIKQILNDCCAGNAGLATGIITDEFIIIPRTVPCDGEVQEDKLGVAVSAGSGPEFAVGSTTDNPNWLRNRAINLLAIADYVESREAILAAKEAEASAARNKRRDELARLFSGVATADFAGQPASTQLAILKVIELESVA